VGGRARADWHRLEACLKCSVDAGQKCRNLLEPAKEARFPHTGRRVAAGKRLIPHHQRKLSRLASIIDQVIKHEGLRKVHVQKMMGWSQTHTCNVLNEVMHPMTVMHAEQILGALGYRLESRAVKLDDEIRQFHVADHPTEISDEEC
jgi:hypothetical protein